MAATASYQPVWSDVEKGSAQDDFAYAFAEKTVRMGFIRKVFGKLYSLLYLRMNALSRSNACTAVLQNAGHAHVSMYGLAYH